jgi:hypothetical protein
MKKEKRRLKAQVNKYKKSGEKDLMPKVNSLRVREVKIKTVKNRKRTGYIYPLFPFFLLSTFHARIHSRIYSPPPTPSFHLKHFLPAPTTHEPAQDFPKKKKRRKKNPNISLEERVRSILSVRSEVED